MKLVKKVAWATSVTGGNQKIKGILFKYKLPRLRNDGNGGHKKYRKCFCEIIALRRGTKKDFIYTGSFLEAVGPVLVMAQCFSIMHVVNVITKNAKDLYYTWKSIRSVYSILVMLITFAFTTLVIFWSMSGNIEFDKIVPVVFYVSNSTARIFFLLLAIKWPSIMQQWEEIENKIPPFETQKEKAMLAFKIKMTSTAVMLVSMSEHLLSIISTAFYSTMCTTNKVDPFEDYFKMELNQLFVYFEYSPYLAFFKVKRFYCEVCNDVVALSGMRFFHLTRGLVLSVAGTIVTYELVLIQFHHIDHESGTC